MAKLEQGILGPFRGKVGTVVGYLWRGRHVVRGYRREINYPNTENQQAERDWFVSMVRFAATAQQALLLGLRERAARDQMTEGNAFVKMNKHCFLRTHAPVAACGGATPSSLEGELKCLQSNSSPKLGEVPEGRRSVLQDGGEYGSKATRPRPSGTPSSLEGVLKCLQPNSSPKLGEVPEGRRSVLQDGGEYGSKATRPRPSGTPSSLEGELKCRDAACRVRQAPAGIPNCKAPADVPGRGAVADTPDRGAVADIPERGAIADAARCVPTEYERIRISEGAAAPVRFADAEIGDSGILRVDFEKNSGMSRAKGSDRVYIYIYNTESKEGLLSAPAERRSGRLQMQLPDGWNELNTKMWGFVVDKEGRASNSAYIAYGTEAAEPRMEDEMEKYFVENGEKPGSKSVDEKKNDFQLVDLQSFPPK